MDSCNTNSRHKKQPALLVPRYRSSVSYCLLLLSLASLFTTQCRQDPEFAAPTPSETATDLGGRGNQRIAAMYAAYHDRRERGNLSGCHSGGFAGKRVIIQGFSAFDGATNNMSGVVASSMALPNFWYDNEPRKPVALDSSNRPYGSGKSGTYGATAVQRTIYYGDDTYEICFVVVDVLWDFAPAVLLYEAAQFHPNLILMSGVGNLPGTARIETAAINHAGPHTGFDPEGEPYPGEEIPRRDEILPTTDRSPSMIPMTWNVPHVEQGAHDGREVFRLITGSTFQTRVIAPADRQNDYICNNISYVTLSGLRGNHLTLAGNALPLTPMAQPKVTAGFFHYPLNPPIASDLVFGWSHVVMRIIESAFKN